MAELGEDTILWFIIATAIAVIGDGKYAIERKIFKMPSRPKDDFGNCLISSGVQMRFHAHSLNRQSQDRL